MLPMFRTSSKRQERGSSKSSSRAPGIPTPLPEVSARFSHETLVWRWSEETVRSFPTKKTYSIYSSFVFTNDRDTIGSLTAIIRKGMKTFRHLYPREKVEFLVTWIHAEGVRLPQGAVHDPDADVGMLNEEDFTDSIAGAP
ncbi:uncharacterized protein A1O5_12147 [Cladophialophora psammophila CBS 110553]|uniref:Uncharacterized protein n=1 Tax=Cladophialophora psammophila CBS 110553 TaxID=1182543 RepID=W9VUW3_9EURO|nr:uncharacterized protein A1O5_12147 [Cladophialophora psammophila CBS 110553]EXJ59522.1 hypothetical protein A1O5_12147 [Cladophialophora psammophila CBS 110553]